MSCKISQVLTASAASLVFLSLSGCDPLYPVFLENRTDRTVRVRGAGNGLTQKKWVEVKAGGTEEAFSAFQASRYFLDVEVDESTFQLPIRSEDAVGSKFLVVLHQEVLDKKVHDFKPDEGYVPDEQTAARVAEAVLSAAYGADQIRRQRPFSATLVNGEWTVTGSLRNKEMLGGVSMAVISKEDGRILRMSHGK